MTDQWQVAEELLLRPADMDMNQIQSALGQMMARQVDYADLYFEYTRREGFSLEEGRIQGGSYGIDSGVGVRAVSGEKTGFAYSDEIVPGALLESAKAARAIATSGGDGSAPALTRGQGPAPLYTAADPLASLSDAAKIEMLETVDAEARAADPRVREVMAGLSGAFKTVLIARADGRLATDVRPLVRLNVQVIVEQDGRREQGMTGGGARTGYTWFDDATVRGYAREAVRQALVNLEAVDAPAGAMDVVLGPGWPGILLHEAIGHGLEGDFNRKGTSAFSGRIGEQVASEQCTVVDDGTLPDRRGSLTVDDEGETTQRTVLIENGVLKGYMQDATNARLMGVAPTGNGRRESYAHRPMPRMTNTYMENGSYDPAEIIASVDKGIYATQFSGGQVDITSGKFVFSASEAYLIENGEITKPVKGATLIGNGPDVLTRVAMVGNDKQLDTGIGTCGKEGQSVPVGVGQPTLKIHDLTVGGTQ
ncbi:protease TldD [Thiohalorhabdus denitrificans]|uniref:TldD protein n=1 Tax=Thiohalorhabdus denitrificans TaxID=381306 RepID=A0A0P9C8P4_9GAMM|nr:metalloprotease TldD [Thiohalorhabdus denitrificans]KPV41372.1 protease TldD [Thiohalorhabdus denitrificans]SCY24945.1 microcin-processing peptidase 2. Unknown type peptidase. MEROPS family U62 [Thiohalorhabdus denitrificans]